MSKIRKKQTFKAIKFRTLKSTKFYSSEIKWVYSIHNQFPAGEPMREAETILVILKKP